MFFVIHTIVLLSLHQLRDWARPMETFDGIIDIDHDGDPACLTIEGDNSSLTRPDDMRFALGL